MFFSQVVATGCCSASEKSGQGVFGAGLGAGVERRRLSPGPKSGCSVLVRQEAVAVILS